jgi:hypothetical protein
MWREGRKAKAGRLLSLPNNPLGQLLAANEKRGR